MKNRHRIINEIPTSESLIVSSRLVTINLMDFLLSFYAQNYVLNPHNKP
jgi:hypothetical protein